MNRASPRISLNGYLLGCGKTTPFAAQDIFPDPQALRSHALAKTGWPLRGPRCEVGGFLFYTVQLEFQNLMPFSRLFTEPEGLAYGSSSPTGFWRRVSVPLSGPDLGIRISDSGHWWYKRSSAIIFLAYGSGACYRIPVKK